MKLRYATLTGIFALFVSAVIGCSAGTPGPAATAANGQKIELTLVNGAGLSVEAIQSANQAFAKTHPNVVVRILGAVDRPLTVDPSGASLAGVDMILTSDRTMRVLAKGGALKALTTTKIPTLDALVQGVYDDLSTLEGIRYGLPIWVTPVVLGMSPEQLTKAGIQPPAPDWTWADAENILQAAKQAGLDIRLDVGSLLDPAVRSYGGTLYHPESKAWGFGDPAVDRGLKMIGRLVQQGVVTAEGGVVTPVDSPTFYVVPTRLSVNHGMVLQPLPRGAQGRPTPATAVVACVPASTLHQDLALEYVRRLVNNPAVQLQLAKARVRPVTADAKAMTTWRETVGERTAEVVQLAMAEMYVDTGSVSMSEIAKGLMPYFQGKVPLDTAVSELLPLMR